MSDAGVHASTGSRKQHGSMCLPALGQPGRQRRCAGRVNAEGLEETCEAGQLIKAHTVDVTDGDAVADAVARIERDQGQ